MEFDFYLTKIQSSLKGIEKSLGLNLYDITTESDEELGAFLTRFKAALKELDASAEEMRKINLFLILNTEFNSSKLVASDVNYSHVIGIIPQLNSYLYFECMINTDLYKYIGEVILFSPEALAVDVMKTVTTYISKIKLNIAVEFLHLIYNAIFQKTIQLQNDSKIDNIKEIFVKALQKLLDFSIFDFSDFSKLTKVKSQCFFGRYVKMMLNFLESSIKRFKTNDLDPSIEIYSVKIDYNYSQWPLLSMNQNWLLNALDIMVCTCKNNMRKISVDIYAAWCEEEFEEGDEKTLQTAVREAAYTLQQALSSITQYEESIMDLPLLISTLSHFALKPQCEDDEIMGADINLIISNMRNPDKTQLKWLKAFLKIENVLSNESCLSILDDTVHIFDLQACQCLLKLILQCVKSGTLNYTYIVSLKNILFKAIKLLKLKEQLQLLEQFYLEKNENLLKTSNFNLSITETFNKMANEDNINKFLPDIVILTLQSAPEVLPHMIDECLKSPPRCDLFINILSDVKIFKELEVSGSDKTPLCLSLVVNKFKDSIQAHLEENTNLMYMIKKFSYHNIIDGKEFLTKHLIPCVQTSLNNKKWEELDLCLDIFSVFLDGGGGEYVLDNVEALVAFLVLLLDKSRQQPPAFTLHSVSVCEKAAAFISTLVSSLIHKKNGVEDKDVKWLKELGAECSPLSWFHLRKLWGSGPLPEDPRGLLTWSLQDLGQDDLTDMSHQKRASFVTNFCKILPLLTSKEWKMIGYDLGGAKSAEKALAVYHILADCFLIFIQIPIMLDNQVCLAYLFSSFIGFIKFKVIGALRHNSRENVLDAFKKLVLLTTELPEGIVKSRVAALVPVFQEMVDTIISKTENGQTQSDLLLSITPITEPTLQSALSQKIIVRLTEQPS